MPAWLAPLLAAAGPIVGGIASAWQANRFSERMSSTAHQREVKDLRAAGLNPMLSARGSGASAPQGESSQLGEGAGRGVSSALAVKAQQAQIDLLKAQAKETDQRGWLANVQASDIIQNWNAGKWDLIRQQVESGALDLEQRRQLLPLVVERAKEEIALTVASAEGARARALLDKYAAQGAFNVQEFEKLVGKMGPAAKFMMQILPRRK